MALVGLAVVIFLVFNGMLGQGRLAEQPLVAERKLQQLPREANAPQEGRLIRQSGPDLDGVVADQERELRGAESSPDGAASPSESSGVEGELQDQASPVEEVPWASERVALLRAISDVGMVDDQGARLSALETREALDALDGALLQYAQQTAGMSERISRLEAIHAQKGVPEDSARKAIEGARAESTSFMAFFESAGSIESLVRSRSLSVRGRRMRAGTFSLSDHASATMNLDPSAGLLSISFLRNGWSVQFRVPESAFGEVMWGELMNSRSRVLEAHGVAERK